MTLEENKEENKKETITDKSEEITAENTKPIEEEAPSENINNDNSEQSSTAADNTDEPIKKKEDSPRKKFTFAKLLEAYVLLWVAIIAVICLILYVKFANYQARYDASEAASNPDLYVMNYLHFFDKDEIATLTDNLKSGINPLEKDEIIEDYVKGYVVNASVSFNRADNFNINKPLYTVTANGTTVGSLLLQPSIEADEFGFHEYELSDISLVVDMPELHSYTVNILEGDTLYINGVDVTDYEHTSTPVSSFMDDEASARSGKVFIVNSYSFDSFVNAPDVVIDREGENITLTLEGDVFENTKMYDDDFLAEVEDRVLATGEAYIYNMNRYGSFDNCAAYLVYYGTAYNSILAAQQGISWAGSPTTFEINLSEITDMTYYSEDTFVVTTHYEFYRLYRDVEYNEEMTIKWLFIKSGDQWYALDFMLGA